MCGCMCARTCVGAHVCLCTCARVRVHVQKENGAGRGIVVPGGKMTQDKQEKQYLNIPYRSFLFVRDAGWPLRARSYAARACAGGMPALSQHGSFITARQNPIDRWLRRSERCREAAAAAAAWSTRRGFCRPYVSSMAHLPAARLCNGNRLRGEAEL